MQLTIGRILSLLLGIAYAAGIVVLNISLYKLAASVAVRSLQEFIPIALAVACVWFPEAIGTPANHPIGRYGIGNSPMLVSITGWLILVALPVVGYFLLQ